MFITAAAQHWNVNRDTCVAKDGGILHGARKNFLTYGELADAASKLPVPDFKTVPLKNPSDFTIVGHDTRRYEGIEKINGTAKFGIDSRVPGMQYAVIERCPIFGGKLKSFDAAKAKAVPGVIDVFPVDSVGSSAFTAGGVVVVADSSWAAMQGRKALQITWDEGPAASESSDSLRKQFLDNAAKPGKVVRNDVFNSVPEADTVNGVPVYAMNVPFVCQAPRARDANPLDAGLPGNRTRRRAAGEQGTAVVGGLPAGVPTPGAGRAWVHGAGSAVTGRGGAAFATGGLTPVGGGTSISVLSQMKSLLL
jgi:isoquinoline 1-oxidoreductase beta subunit